MITNANFVPAWWLNSRHLQTIYPALFRTNQPLLPLHRERLITPDGDFIDLDFSETAELPLVILLHGLAGSSKSGYIQGLQLSLQAAGFASVAMNFRGCSGQMNQRARCYHSGETEDIEFVYQTLRQRFPQRQMAAVGFSLGGNVLLKWLGEQAAQSTLFAAVAVSVPLQLNVCASQLDQGLSRLYRDYLLRELKQYMVDKLNYLQQIGLEAEAAKIRQLGSLAKVKSFWEYDELVVAGLHGFASAEDYYQRSSARQFLKTIQVPTLIVHALDDPFMTADVLPEHDQLSSQVQLELCQKGGHVGFVSTDSGFTPSYWLDKRIPAFLRQVSLNC